MKISCPDCQFTSEMAEEALPKQNAIATCPKCGCRFRFSPTEGVLGKLESKFEPKKDEDLDSVEPQAETLKPKEEDKPREDDPLPEGAIVIRTNKRPKVEENDDYVSNSSSSENFTSERKFSSAKSRSQTDNTPYAPKGTKRRSSNPWDRAPGRIGWLASFYQTCLRIMFAAPRFFASLSPKASFHPALTFFVIICLFEFLLNYVWVNLFRGMVAGSSDPQLIELFALLAPQGNVLLRLILQTAVGVLKLYVLSSLFLLVFQVIVPQRSNFNLIYQVVAYSTAPAVLCVVPIAGSLAGTLWSLACL
ncbi:MAG: zinc-ribbon domain-containing protein, partial [Desulfovibrionaceae bacterium]|nr:zinc-ribbon domain-containing protein [Desulfovibrionaceae bacterium]